MESITNTDIQSLQLSEAYRKYPIDDHGKLRYAYGKVTAAGALSQNGTMALVSLPIGRKRILPGLSRITTSAFGASRTLDVGHQAYNVGTLVSSIQADDPDAFVDGLDVSSAVTNGVVGTGLKFDMFSQTDVVVYATVLGGTFPDGGTVELLLAYLYE